MGTRVNKVDKEEERQNEGCSHTAFITAQKTQSLLHIRMVVCLASVCPYIGEVSWAAGMDLKSGDPETK